METENQEELFSLEGIQVEKYASYPIPGARSITATKDPDFLINTNRTSTLKCIGGRGVLCFVRSKGMPIVIRTR